MGHGILTLVAAVLAVMAMDDITTDSSTSFAVEYTLLSVCAAWCAYLAARLWCTRHRVLATLSLTALVAGAAAAAGGFGTKAVGGWSSFWPEYTAVTAALLWFLALSITLIVVAARTGQARPRTSQ